MVGCKPVVADSLFIIAVLSLNVAVSEWLARQPILRHAGSALLVILLTAVTANAGLIPTYSAEIPVYRHIFEELALLAIFLLLLRINLRSVFRAGGPMILLFLVGSAGTMGGVLVGMAALGGADAFGRLHYALAGMFVGTYTGGSINFNAIALEYEVVKDGILYTGAAAVDSAATMVWMAVTVGLPRLLSGLWPVARRRSGAPTAEDDTGRESGSDIPATGDLAVLMTLGLSTIWAAERAHVALIGVAGIEIPVIIILTTLALSLAQLPIVQRLRGAQVCGMLAVMYFLAVIGALCDVSSVARLGPLGMSLILFVALVILVHGISVFGFAACFRIDPAIAAVASQANIGGSTSALALARSLARGDLVLPAILVGSLGNALGTYLGFLVATALR